MEEVFVEHIIKRRTGIVNALLRIVSIFAVLLAALSIVKLMMLGITITALVAYGAYLVWCYTSVEYEYSFLNGELTIDKIMGQRKRKTIVSYDTKQAEIIAPSFSEEIIRRVREIKTEDYSSGYNRNEIYSMIINDSNGTVQVLFEPDEKMIDAMQHVIPRIVKKSIRTYTV